jgi:hypothetical protein
MDECHIEMIRKIGFERLGKVHSEETIAKMKGAPLHKKYPPKCNKCNSRDAEMCARHNMECFAARNNVCFVKYMKRKVHPDYVKKGVRHV